MGRGQLKVMAPLLMGSINACLELRTKKREPKIDSQLLGEILLRGNHLNPCLAVLEPILKPMQLKRVQVREMFLRNEINHFPHSAGERDSSPWSQHRSTVIGLQYYCEATTQCSSVLDLSDSKSEGSTRVPPEV